MTQRMEFPATRTGFDWPETMDRRWLSCGDPKFCPAAVLEPSPLLVASVNAWGPAEWAADRKWLTAQLTRFTGPPGMDLRTLRTHEMLGDLDHYAILLRIPLPNSQDPSQLFPVGRLGYSTGTLYRDEERLKSEVRELFRGLALHEVDEWLRRDGVHVQEPHPGE